MHLLKIGTIVALLLPVSFAQAQKGTSDMTIARKTEMKTVDGPEAYFTGKVTITGRFSATTRLAPLARSSISSPAPGVPGTPTQPARR
jgi:hypothetical protein